MRSSEGRGASRSKLDLAQEEDGVSSWHQHHRSVGIAWVPDDFGPGVPDRRSLCGRVEPDACLERDEYAPDVLTFGRRAVLSRLPLIVPAL